MFWTVVLSAISDKMRTAECPSTNRAFSSGWPVIALRTVECLSFTATLFVGAADTDDWHGIVNLFADLSELPLIHFGDRIPGIADIAGHFLLSEPRLDFVLVHFFNVHVFVPFFT
jgi:hypothetical protein